MKHPISLGSSTQPDPEKLIKDLAKFYRQYYCALVDQGFTEEQSLKLLEIEASRPTTPPVTGRR